MTKGQHADAATSIKNAVARQSDRYNSGMKNNSNLSSREIKKYLALSPDVRQLLTKATDRLNLSARSYFKVIKVARTIADLDGNVNITAAHVSEALQYRQNT